MQLTRTTSTLATLAIAAVASAGDVGTADYPVNECGVLMSDYYYGCAVFVPFDYYSVYLIDDTGDFEIGDTVNLSGIATFNCASPCNFDACIFGPTIETCTLMPGDLDGDGSVGPADLASLLSQWGECPAKAPCLPDLNDDQVVGPADLAVLLANWTS